jgi:hypothetical protein
VDRLERFTADWVARPGVYRFTDKPCREQVKLDIPMMEATNDWQQWVTTAAATERAERG